MKEIFKPYLAVVAVVLVIGVAYALSERDTAEAAHRTVVPLKEAKLNIEHNATDEDTGFQGAVDSEGWKELIFRNPNGDVVLEIEGVGELGTLGLTELFFETVEPANVDVPLADILDVLPEGNYALQGSGIEFGEKTGKTAGTAWLTHDIPKGPVLVLPAEDAEVPADEDLVIDWEPVTQTITGEAVTIIANQLIVERHTEAPEPHMIGKRGSLSMYVSPSVTSMPVPKEFLEEGIAYDWEVLAIEESGNQTLSSSRFSTE